nr:MAG TPA: Type II secretion system, protein M [Caudoviricetes sp.]
MTGVIVAILSLCGVIFNYAVIKPLSTSIEELRELIESTQEYIRGVEEKRQNMAERLAKVEASAASAHHRMDTLEKRMNQ